MRFAWGSRNCPPPAVLHTSGIYPLPTFINQIMFPIVDMHSNDRLYCQPVKGSPCKG